MVEVANKQNRTRSSYNQELSSIASDSFGSVDYKTPISEFNAVKQASLFQKIKDREFSGRMFFYDRDGIESVFYFYLGRLIYATGGLHPMRRWYRALNLYCPEILQQEEVLRGALGKVTDPVLPIAWEYQVLTEWAKQRAIPYERVSQIIRFSIEEVLFDLTRSREVSYYRQADRMDGFNPLTLINSEQCVANVWQQWQDWLAAKLGDRSPNKALIVKNIDELAKHTSPFTVQMFKQRLDGNNTLRDLAIELKQELVPLARTLLMYVQLGMIDMVSVRDLPSPFGQNELPPVKEIIPRTIVYGDENAGMRQCMREIFEKIGHKCITVQDGLKAISLLVETRPDLIILNSNLLHTDGYNICKTLRQLPQFQKTPIFIFTENLGLAERIRAKISGASEIIETSSSPEVIYQLISKYL